MGFIEGRLDDSPATYRDVKEIIRYVRNNDNNLFLILFIAAATAFGVGRLWNIPPQIKSLEEKVAPVMQTENVLGGAASDQFYIIDGDTVYLEVDSRPVGEYFR